MGATPFCRILLTGADGFVGGYLAPALAAFAPRAERLALRRPGIASGPKNWPVAEADIADRGAVADIVARFRPDLIVHLAAQSSVGGARDAAEATWRVNFDGSFALASACARAASTATFVFVSSSEVYGLSFLGGPLDEDAPLRPINVYARTKAAAEAVIADVLPERARLVVTRSFNHIGPGQDERFALPSFAAQIARIEAGLQPPLVKVGNLDAERDFLDVRDVCDAYLALIALAPELPARSVFNVASGVARSLHSLLEAMRAQSATPFEIAIDPERLRASEIPRAVGVSDKLRARTGWAPSRPIEDTLAAMLQRAREALGEV
jgi:GDP-4-dehydro-6-deoxy-D-mannose reductase